MLPKLSNRICIAIAAISFCFVPLISCAADDSANIRVVVDRAIHPLMTKYDVPGIAIAVTIDGHSFVFNYGVASREKKIPISDVTMFEIGSVSKTFTATLASYAQVLGKLSLDDHPSKYMPQLKGNAIDKVSLLNLGTYTSGGLPLQFPEEISELQMLDYFRQWKPVAAAGTQRIYSNPSIGLLGHISALALKSDFADALETQLFPQLGLTSTYIRIPESAMSDYAWGYNQANKPVRVNPGVFAAEAYGVKSTAADMIRFVQANIAPSKLDTAMQRAVEGTHIGFFKVGEIVQGLGWEQYSYPTTLKRLLAGNSDALIFDANTAMPLALPQISSGPVLFDKTGSTNGFGAYIAFVPEEKIGVVMLANKNFPIPARVKAVYAILEQLRSMAR